MLYDNQWQVLFEDSLQTVSGRASSTGNSQNRSDVALNALKHYIVTNRLRPGDPMPTEAKLCDELGISRTAVREALRRLEALDVIVSVQGRGSFVSDLSLRPLVESLVLRTAIASTDQKVTLQDVIFTRQAIDLGNAEPLCAVFRDHDDPVLRDLVAKMMRKAAAGQTFMDEDIAFHSQLNSYLDNTLLAQLTGSMWVVHMAIVPRLENVDAQGLVLSAKSHGNMLDALVQGDPQAYREAVKSHYDPLRGRL